MRRRVLVLIVIAGLLALAGVLFPLLLRVSWWWLAVGLLLSAGCLAVAWWLGRAKGPSGAAGGAWEACVAALGARPCWLVLGATASGKSALLGESGVAWNLRPPPGAGTGQPTLWRSEVAGLIELPGAWSDAVAAAPAWSSWLAQARRTRERCAPRGLVVCVSLADLLRRGPGHVAALAAGIRSRQAELVAALGLAPPLYLVLTKADQIGGFKDFFAGLSEAERQQVLGVTLPWPAEGIPAAWAEGHRDLVAALRDRRPLGLLRARDGEAARKLFQFPGQLESLHGPVGELLAHLCAPGADAAAAVRGVYLASCHRQAASLPAAPAERTDLERSVYLGRTRAAPSVGGIGLFSHGLLSQVLPADVALARPVRDRSELGRVLVLLGRYVVPSLAAVIAIWLVLTAWQALALLGTARTAAAEVRAVERLHPGDAPRNLDALDRLGAAVAALAANGTAAAQPASTAAASLYARRLGELCAGRAVGELAARITALRTVGSEPDALYDAFRCYQMLAGAVPAEAEVIERELLAERRWFAGLEPAGARLDWPTEVLARTQLERLGRELLPRGLARCTVDRSLVDAAARDLGEALWIRQGWDDIVRAARSQCAATEASVQVGVLRPGPLPEGALTLQAWKEVVEDEIDEKSAALEATLAGLSIPRDREVIRRRLAERFRVEHRRAWLGYIAGTATLPAEDPAALPARISEAAGPTSTWPGLVRRALDELDPPSALAALNASSRAPWVRPALDPLLALRGEVETFLAIPGVEPERVAQLARRFDEAAAAACARLAEVQPDDLREALRQGVRGLAHGLWRPIDRVAAAGLESAWRAKVVPAWRRSCAGRFPFSEASSEVTLSEFARFVNPRSGVLWLGMAPIEGLRAQSVAGRPALTVSRAYLDMAARAQQIRDGFFPSGGESVAAVCHLTLVQREGVSDVAFGVGSQLVRLYDRPDARYEVVLRQGEPAGAKIAIRVVTGEWKTLEFARDDWGLLRLLRAGTPRAAADGGWTLTWPFAGTAASKDVTWRAQALLEAPALGEAAAGDLLSGFLVPEAILPEGES
jgi:type VI protein secretion system component VasK